MDRNCEQPVYCYVKCWMSWLEEAGGGNVRDDGGVSAGSGDGDSTCGIHCHRLYSSLTVLPPQRFLL
jgi:hypothetical protein